jgi:hypothetical protein
MEEACVPVRPRTRVTLTSLTGTLEESIFETDRVEEDEACKK